MDDIIIILKCLAKIKAMPYYEYISFYELIANIFGNDEAKRLENESDLFELYYSLIRELKKEKIYIKDEYNEGKKVGTPYSISFCKVDPRIEIKKITINHSYGCFGIPEEIYRKYISFKANSVKYVHEPMVPTRMNPTIKYNYNPFNNRFCEFLDDNNNNYKEDFKKLCCIVNSLIGKTIKEDVCDAIPPSIDVEFVDKRKVNISLPMIYSESDDNLIFIFDMADRYIPGAAEFEDSPEEGESDDSLQ